MILTNGGVKCDVLVVVHQDADGAVTKVETSLWDWGSTPYPPRKAAQENVGRMLVSLDDGSRASYYRQWITLPWDESQRKIVLDWERP